MKLSTRIRRSITDPIVHSLLQRLLRLEDSLNSRPGAVHHNEHSPERFDMLGNNLALKDDHAPLPGFPKSAPFMGSSIRTIFRSIQSLDTNPANPDTSVSPEFPGQKALLET